MRALLTAAALFAIPCAAAGQARPDLPKHGNDCRVAEQVVTTGHPANKLEWAWGRVPSCGADGATAITTAIGTLETAADSVLGARLLHAAVFLKDAGMLNGFLAVAATMQTPAESRVMALQAVLAEYNDGLAVYDEHRFRTDGARGFCGLGLGTPATSDTAEAFPPDVRTQIARAMQQIVSAGASSEVASAAWCVRNGVEAGDDLLFTPALVTLHPECGGRFTGHSAHDRNVTLEWRAAGADSGSVDLPPGRDLPFMARAAGPVTFSAEGHTLGTLASQAPCGS